MDFQKRLDCVCDEYQIPPAPRVPNSAKGKRSTRKKVEQNQMCAFDLLATVAGKVLAERDGFWTSCKAAAVICPTSLQEHVELPDDENILKDGVFGEDSCNESMFSPLYLSRNLTSPKQHLRSRKSSSASYTPAYAISDGTRSGFSAKKLIPSGSRGTLTKKNFNDGKSGSPMKSCLIDDATVISVHGEPQETKRLMHGALRINNLEERMDFDTKPPSLVSSDGSIDLPPYRDHHRTCKSSFSSIRDANELTADRNDEENSSGGTHPRFVHSSSLNGHCIAHHNTSKLTASNYRKADPASCLYKELPNVDVGKKTFLTSQKLFYTRQRTQRCLFKRRRLLEDSSVSISSCSFHGKSVPYSPTKDGIMLGASNLDGERSKANNISCGLRGQNSLYESVDNPVKLSIKSFRVPELFIEIPENATIGSLKMTVVEAIMAVLGDGMRVGVLLQGKKVRDDNKILRQAGISSKDMADSLGFVLEPNAASSSAHLHRLPRFDSSPMEPPSSVDKMAAVSKALVPVPVPVPVPVRSSKELAVVPHRKSRRSEIVRRRIRRPFSVSEVEALVQAVEMLGTGRWRDVKVRAFDNAKHRTYVDLKDKWKTLVHTARISPQQRRGEPVPQQLLDRVLSAHAHWSQQHGPAVQ